MSSGGGGKSPFEKPVRSATAEDGIEKRVTTHTTHKSPFERGEEMESREGPLERAGRSSGGHKSTSLKTLERGKRSVGKKKESPSLKNPGAATFARALEMVQQQRNPTAPPPHNIKTLQSQQPRSTPPPSTANKITQPPPPPPPTDVKISDVKPKGPLENPNYDLLTFKADTVEAQELFSKSYNTAEEKYRALEGRDKLLRARIPKVKVSVEEATKLFGTCLDMCPEKERYMRQYQRQLTVFEILNSPELIVDDKKAVKAYSRSSADQEEPLPHDLRPGSTLEMTMDYLLHNIVPIAEKEEDMLADWYNFLWDRTRSIRKDITQQQLTDLQAVSLMEKCTRFHIHCSSRLCELDLHAFEPKLNDENLMKCLQSLEHLYDDLRRRNIKCPNEPEFRAYQIMMNLNEGDILWDAQQRPDWVLKSPQVRLALKIHHIVFNKNFVAFFRIIKNSSYMVSCILHRYFFQVRCAALRSLWKAHSCPPKTKVQVSFSAVQRMLGYGDSVAGFQYVCQSHGIMVDGINDRLVMNRKSFNMPESKIVSREENLIESKLHTSVAEAINGAPLGPNPAITYKPHSSFDQEGYLIPGSIARNKDSDSTLTRFIVPGQPLDNSLNQSKGVFEGSSSFASVANQKSLFPGFFKSPFQTKGGFGRSVSPQQAFQFTGSRGAQNSVATAASRKEGSVANLNMFKQVVTPEQMEMQKNEAIQAACRDACDKILEKILVKEVMASAELVLQAAEKERLERLQEEEKERNRNRMLNAAADQIEVMTIERMVAEIITEEIHKYKLIKRMCEMYSEEVGVITVDYLLPFIAKEAMNENIMEQRKIVEKVGIISQRLKMRTIIYKWRESVKAKKLEKKLQEEKVVRDRLEFPATNRNHKSKEDVLKALCGVGKRSPNVGKGARKTRDWVDSYERIESVRKGYVSKVEGVAMEILHSFSDNDSSMEASAVVVTRRSLDNEYCSHCWKRRWSDETSEDKRFVGGKSPRLELCDSPEGRVGSQRQPDERQSLLDEIKLFMEEAVSEKRKAFVITPLECAESVD